MIPAYEILTQCVALTKSDANDPDPPFVDFTAEGDAQGIPDDQIVAISDSYRRDNRDRFAVLQKPGVVYTVQRISEPASAGTNNYSYASYEVLAQILDTDLVFHDTNVFKSRLKWEYELRRFFAMGNARNTINDATDGTLENIHVHSVDLLRQREFELFDDCVSATRLLFKMKEYHSASGRT